MNLQLNDNEVQLLQMALYEYIGHRYPIDEYMDKRYPQQEHSPKFRADKRDDVMKRVELAQELRNRLFTD